MKLKTLYVVLCFALLGTRVFAIEKAIIGSEKANVINEANAASSSVLYQLEAGDEILIYSSWGDGSFENGVYKLWYRISSEKAEWVNALSVVSFPFENSYVEHSQHESFGCYQNITDYKKEGGKLYFLCSFCQFGSSNIKRNEWIDANTISWVDNKSRNLAYFSTAILPLLQEQFLLIPDTTESYGSPSRIVTTYTISNALIDAVVETGGFLSCHLKSLRVKSRDVRLPFGIYLGMEAEELKHLFGEPAKANAGELEYRIGYGFIVSLFFGIEDGKLRTIRFTSVI